MSEKLDENEILQNNAWLSGVKIVAETSSTQQLAKADGQANCLYLTEKQTATYGRFGRQYFAADDGGIYMSLLLKPAVTAHELPQYTLLAAAAVVTAIEKLTDQKPQIKWVNDLYLGSKKFVGILAESAVRADELQVVIGIGINFSITDFPAEIAQKATSLFPDGKPTISRNQLISQIWAEFHRLQNEDFFSIYKVHSFILGKQVTFVQNKITYSGQAIDLTDAGELVVRLTDGSQKILSSGEISLTSWQ